MICIHSIGVGYFHSATSSIFLIPFPLLYCVIYSVFRFWMAQTVQKWGYCRFAG